jgi:Fur family transcriptional regulator, zinc uptake regulator
MNVQQALTHLKQEGYKLTDHRELLLKLFSNDKRYISAKEVLGELKENIPGLSFDTIYRNLSLFVDLNILETTELDGERKFRFSCATKEHHHHLICLNCGKTKQIKQCPMTLYKSDHQDFNVVGHKFEVYGYCTNCKPKEG